MLALLLGRGRLMRRGLLLYVSIVHMAAFGLPHLVGLQDDWLGPLSETISHRAFGGLSIRTNLLALAAALPFEAARFRDANFSGWFALLCPVAVLGMTLGGPWADLLLLVAGFLTLAPLFWSPTRGPNRFGPDPRAPASSDSIARQGQPMSNPSTAD